MSQLDVDLLTQVPCSVLVTSTLNHPTSFLLPHFLKEYLQSGVNVLLVTVNNDAEHFCKIGRKMGIALQSYIDSHSLYILDLLSIQKTASAADIHPAFSFEHLFKLLVGATKRSWQGEKPGLVLIIESLTSLLSLNDKQELFWSFCRYCTALSRSIHQQPYGFLTVIDSEIDAGQTKQIQSLFDFIIEPIPIDLISIANVDGKIKLRRHRLLSSESQSKLDEFSTDVTFSMELFFRVRESGVVLFPDVDLCF